MLGALALTLPVLWMAPISPLAMERGNVLYGLGHIDDAITHFDRVGRMHPLGSMRVAANERAATVAMVDLVDSIAARAYLTRVIESSASTPETKANAWERLADLAWTSMNDPEEAAAAYQMAYELDMMGPHAARRLMASARARTESGATQRALEAWERVAKRLPKERPHARIAQASLLLSGGDTISALEHYEEALATGSDPTVLQVARLGMATCKERMGQIDEAIADIDAADLPSDVATERQRRLSERTEDL